MSASAAAAVESDDVAPSRRIAPMLGALWPPGIDDASAFATASSRPLNAMAPASMESAAAATELVLALVSEEQLSARPSDFVQLKRRGHQQHKQQPAHIRFSDVMDADLLAVSFQFLDFASLSTCELVARQWRRVLQHPLLWEQLYCCMWRHGKVLLPTATEYRHALLPHFKRLCRARCNSQVEVYTRARTWMRKNGNVFSHNDSMQHRDFRFGCTESIRTERAMPSLACAQVLGMGRICYFEATVSGCGSVGFASVTTPAEQTAYGFGSESHLGWYPTSYGYHGDDGLFYWNAGQRTLGALGGAHQDFGPQWGDTTPFRLRRWKCATIGCGYIASTRELFYTMDGKFVGVAPVLVEEEKEYAAAVTLHQFGDSVEINFGCNAFAFDVEQFVWEKRQALQKDKDKDNDDADDSGKEEEDDGDSDDDNVGRLACWGTAHAA